MNNLLNLGLNDLVEIYENVDPIIENVDPIPSKNVIEYKEMIDNSKKIDSLYIDTIDRVGVVSWCLMNKIYQSPISTQKKRLNRLVSKGYIKKSKDGLFSSLSYNHSRNDLHNLWIGSLSLDCILKGYEFIRDIEIMKDRKYMFSRNLYEDNFCGDLVVFQKNGVCVFEVELHKKNNLILQSKLEGYIDNLNSGFFGCVVYYTNNIKVKKQVEYYKNYLGFKGNIEVVLTNEKDLMIK